MLKSSIVFSFLLVSINNISILLWPGSTFRCVIKTTAPVHLMDKGIVLSGYFEKQYIWELLGLIIPLGHWLKLVHPCWQNDSRQLNVDLGDDRAVIQTNDLVIVRKGSASRDCFKAVWSCAIQKGEASQESYWKPTQKCSVPDMYSYHIIY